MVSHALLTRSSSSLCFFSSISSRLSCLTRFWHSSSLKTNICVSEDCQCVWERGWTLFITHDVTCYLLEYCVLHSTFITVAFLHSSCQRWESSFWSEFCHGITHQFLEESTIPLQLLHVLLHCPSTSCNCTYIIHVHVFVIHCLATKVFIGKFACQLLEGCGWSYIG